MNLVLGIALGGALGAPTRYGTHHLIHRIRPGHFPKETFVINVVGSLLLGIVGSLLIHGHISTSVSAFLGTGFLGAFTTFSTFTLETFELIEEGRLRLASINVVASFVIGIGAAGIGYSLGLL